MIAAAPVDKSLRLWTYANRYQFCEGRFKDGVGTGESVPFGFSNGDCIQIRQTLAEDRAVEVWFLIAEAERGGLPTRARAGEAYKAFRTSMAETIRPGTAVGGRRSRTQPTLSNDIQTTGYEVWTVDPGASLKGSMAPGDSLAPRPLAPTLAPRPSKTATPALRNAFLPKRPV